MRTVKTAEQKAKQAAYYKAWYEKNKAGVVARMAAYKRKLRRAGRCLMCTRPCAKGQSHCVKHLLWRLAWAKGYRAVNRERLRILQRLLTKRRLAKGLCRSCTRKRLDSSWGYCRRHLLQARARRKAKYLRWQRAGLCPYCGKARAPERAACAHHLALASRRNTRNWTVRAAKRRRQGVCLNDGKPVQAGLTRLGRPYLYCSRCGASRREAVRRYHHRRTAA